MAIRRSWFIDCLHEVSHGSRVQGVTGVSRDRLLPVHTVAGATIGITPYRTHVHRTCSAMIGIECGLHAAAVWRETEIIVGRSGDELRQEEEEIRRWDEVIVEMRAITD